MSNFHPIDLAILVAYAVTMLAMGFWLMRKSNTAHGFMVAGQAIPAWAAGLAIMSTYTSSISYIATPGKSFEADWHPIIFALAIFPVAWAVCRWVIAYYRRNHIISVYSLLEKTVGPWARFYASLSFLLYMVGRMATILYLASLLLQTFLPEVSIVTLIVVIGIVTIIYTLMGGMEAVIWTDVIQSIVMIVGLLFCVGALTIAITGPDDLLARAIEANKFSWGSMDLTLNATATRTIWVMIIFGIVENLRNLMADQNYVQKYTTVATEAEARRSIWIAMLIYIPLTGFFLYIGTALYAYYDGVTHVLPPHITKGDQVFPHYIATVVPVGLKGLIVAAILAAAMSTIDSALNCSATITFLDFRKRLFGEDVSEAASVRFLRVSTIAWGIVGTVFAILMIRAGSILDVWWKISGIFGGGILGLFVLALFRARINLWQGLVAITASVLSILWATFLNPAGVARLPEGLQWIPPCNLDGVLAGTVGLVVLLVFGFAFTAMNGGRRPKEDWSAAVEQGGSS